MEWLTDGTWKKKIFKWEKMFFEANPRKHTSQSPNLRCGCILSQSESFCTVIQGHIWNSLLSWLNGPRATEFPSLLVSIFSFSVKVTIGNCLKYTAYKSCPSHKCSTSFYFLFSSQCIAQTKVGQHIWIKYINISYSFLFLHNTQILVRQLQRTKLVNFLHLCPPNPFLPTVFAAQEIILTILPLLHPETEISFFKRTAISGG